MTEVERLILKYQAAREKDYNAQGYYRCEKLLKGGEKCPQQCRDCNQYYIDKLNEK